MKKLTLDLTKTVPYIKDYEIGYLNEQVKTADKVLMEKSGAGSEYTGWVDLPVNYDKAEFEKIKKAAEKIKSDSQVLIVIGIGGSYLGARAAIEMLNHTFYNNLTVGQRKTPEIYYVGNNISSTYITDLFEAIEGLDVSVNVISKSFLTDSLYNFKLCS